MQCSYCHLVYDHSASSLLPYIGHSKCVSSPSAVLCCAVLCCAVLCCAVLCCAVLCCAVLCCAVLRCIMMQIMPFWQ